jgi:hypothetical protein
MSRAGAAVAMIVALLGAGPAAAQDPADPIDAILRGGRETATTGYYVQQTGRAPDGPPTAEDLAYDERLRAALAAAQGFQGPLDGGWTLSGAAGDLYGLQLIDHDGVVEGAWRDLRRPPGPDASGFVDAVEAAQDGLTLRFAGRTAVLHTQRDGWRGELTDEGRTVAVSLRRAP